MIIETFQFFSTFSLIFTSKLLNNIFLILRARMALQELDIDPDDVTTEDFSSLRYVCEVVSRRASFMASAGITALLKKMDYKDVVIAIDGSLFR